jgi:endonuclease/exonuclease/phosphatase family metal-dependent hydrolase
VALGKARDSADLGRLAAHARALDADVVAFQEVEDADTARRVFGGHVICIASGPGVQHVGFAVRRGLAHHCGPEVTTLTAGGRGRAGMSLTLFPPGAPAIDLLAVHLKSGCARDPLDSDSAACRLLSAQAAALGNWIAWRTTSGIPFMVLGDFNRAGSRTPDDPFWGQLDPASFMAAADSLPFGNCVFGAPYSEFIDHILVSRDLAPHLADDPFDQLPFRTRDAARYRLSDHCPLRVSLNQADSL